MAAPLPVGAALQALPTAPQINPGDFTTDALSQLKAAHMGMELGGQLARLGDLQQQLELERAQRKAEIAVNDYKLQQTDHAIRNLPKVMQAQMTAVEAEQAQNANARALALEQARLGMPAQSAQIANAQGALALETANARTKAGIPQKAADLEAAQATNSLNTANANAGFSKLDAPAQTQALEGAKALGGWGISSGDGGTTASGLPPMGLRKTVTGPKVDPVTGNTVETSFMIDARDGSVVKETPLGVSKLGVDEKSVGSSAKEARSLIQTKDMAAALKSSLEEYRKLGQGGLGQALATNAANQAPTGQWSVIKKALGAKFQSNATVGVVSNLQALKNTIANDLFGSALSKEESSNLQGMLPTSEDLANPDRAMLKLDQSIKYLDTKLKPYLASGILEKAKLLGAAPSPAPTAAPAPKSAFEVAASDMQSGKPVMYNGVPHRLSRDANGKPVLIPIR